uniref:Uncharacterized protein n=1 Tax=Octopus bimaculoides TaxID=37653 RepID=A0A0L8IB57_OCTBM
MYIYYTHIHMTVRSIFHTTKDYLIYFFTHANQRITKQTEKNPTLRLIRMYTTNIYLLT